MIRRAHRFLTVHFGHLTMTKHALPKLAGYLGGVTVAAATLPGAEHVFGAVGAKIADTLHGQHDVKFKGVLTVDSLSLDKIQTDHKLPCVSSVPEFEQAICAYKLAHSKTSESKSYSDLKLFPFPSDTHWVKERIDLLQYEVDFAHRKKRDDSETGRPTRDYVPERLEKHAAQVLRFVEKENKGKPLRVSCQCIQTAALAAVLSMTDTAFYGIPIKVNYRDTCGVNQVKSVSARAFPGLDESNVIGRGIPRSLQL